MIVPVISKEGLGGLRRGLKGISKENLRGLRGGLKTSKGDLGGLRKTKNIFEKERIPPYHR